MQLYFVPYTGYYQIIFLVDRFVLLDNIQCTIKSRGNRNRILVNAKDKCFTIPIKILKRFFHINQRYLSSNSEFEYKNILDQIRHSFSKNKNLKKIYHFFKNIFFHNNLAKLISLFKLIYNSISITCEFLKIKNRVTCASDIIMNYNLKSENFFLKI